MLSIKKQSNKENIESVEFSESNLIIDFFETLLNDSVSIDTIYEFKNKFQAFRSNLYDIISEINISIIYEDSQNDVKLKSKMLNEINNYVEILKKFKNNSLRDPDSISSDSNYNKLGSIIDSIYETQFNKDFFVRDFKNNKYSNCEIFLDTTWNQLNNIILSRISHDSNSVLKLKNGVNKKKVNEKWKYYCHNLTKCLGYSTGVLIIYYGYRYIVKHIK